MNPKALEKLSMVFAILFTLMFPVATLSAYDESGGDIGSNYSRLVQLDPADEELDQVSEPIDELSEPIDDAEPEPLYEEQEQIGEESEYYDGSDADYAEPYDDGSYPEDEYGEPGYEEAENLPYAPEGDGSDLEYDRYDEEMPLGDREAEGMGIGEEQY